MIPDMMRVSVLDAPRALRMEERPVPSPGVGEVLVRVGSVGVCGSDAHYFHHGRIGPFVVREPLVLGHEAGGVIASVGDGVPEQRRGERVSLEPGVPCRRCAQCRVGAYNLCPDIRFFATPPVDGAFCEYVAIADDFAHPVPDSLSDDAAALVEPLSVALWANGKASVGPGTSLVVAGAGPVGLLVAQTARALGASEVMVSDVDAHRRDLATRFGATTTLDPAADRPDPSEIRVNAFIDCSGAPAAVAAGIPLVEAGGTVVLVGMGQDEMTIPVSLVQNRELVLTGTFRYANTWPGAIGLAAGGHVDLDGLVTGHVGLARVQDALDPDPGQRHIKVIVRPGEP